MSDEIPPPAAFHAKNHNPFIIATRIHLGKQSNPPPQSKLESTLATFIQTASDVGASQAVIAVDPEPKIEGYDLIHALEEALNEVTADILKRNTDNGDHVENPETIECELLKVSPWGNFVPALNALVSYACTKQLPGGSYAKSILFISAETTMTKESMMVLQQHLDLDDTLVVGAALPGHDYVDCSSSSGDQHGEGGSIGREVELNGRTCPWNTLALWNIKKMILGFPLVADGIHHLDDGRYDFEFDCEVNIVIIYMIDF